jgi:hypothetical protein
MHPEGPATGFLGLPLSLSKCRDGSKVPSCYCVLLMQPSRLKLINIKLPCSQSHSFFFLQNFTKSEIKILPPLSQATASNCSKAFTFSLLLPGGPAAETWEPSYKMMLFPLPTIKRLFLFPGLFTFIYSSAILSTCLTLLRDSLESAVSECSSQAARTRGIAFVKRL